MNRKFTSAFLALLFVSLLISAPRAQQTSAQQSPENRIELYQALIDLTNPWTVMCVAAHPDDEDGTSLIVMRRKYGAHTLSLFSTFGEGGQNAIGPELYEELGAIRARETMAASEIQGSEPYFLGLKDFGFSKSRDETFQKWGQEEALRRMVLQIRKLRPDVIITNHSVTSNDHGHHQATARLVVEAFDAAADPKRFAEQLKDGVEVWQVQRLFVRVRGSQPPPADAQLVTIDPNERDPVRNTMFAEQSLAALQKHATQGPWPKTFAEFTARFRAFSGQAGATGQMPLIRYRLERQAKNSDALPKDLRSFLDGMRLPDTVAEQLAPPMIDGKPLTQFIDQPETLISALLSATKTAMLSRPSAKIAMRSNRIVARLNAATAMAVGVKATLSSADSDYVVRRDRTPFLLLVSNSGKRRIQVKDEVFRDPEQEYQIYMSVGHSFLLMPNQGKTIKVPSVALISYLPSDLRNVAPRIPIALRDPEYVNTVKINVDGSTIEAPITPRLTLASAVEITGVAPATAVATAAGGSSRVSVMLQIINRQHTDFRGRLTTYKVSSCAKRPCVDEKLSSEDITLSAGSKRSVSLHVPVLTTTHGAAGKTFDVYFQAEVLAGTDYWEPLGRSETIAVGYSDARVGQHLRVGYIRGFDFSLPSALNALGVGSKELTINDVKTADLSKYTSIIVDNRVYESQPELISANQKLLDYANAGGNLIVFYHRIDEFNPNPQRNRPQLAPYKLILGNERITDENAPISFIEPDHPLLNSPNKLNQDDFKDWIQERGLYYPKEWDAQFHALLQSNDPGEAPLKGGLLVADYGKGHYIYTSMVWYRQLRAGVPGAYRMLANMISYGHQK